MWKSLIFCTVIWGFIQIDYVQPKPQDFQAAAAMVVAAAKGAIDNGAAAKDKKEISIMGATFKNDMAVGFGDAMNDKPADSSDESDESDRRKRSASFENESPLKTSELNDLYRRKRSESFQTFPQPAILQDPSEFMNSTSTEDE